MNVYLVWLEWPEECFRVNDADLAFLRSLVPADSEIVRARSEEDFLSTLPRATHAIVWNFKSAWFALAPKLRVLATPAAGRELVPESGPEGVKIHFGHFHGEIMAETVVAFILAWARGFFALSAHRRSGAEDAAWPRTWLSSRCRSVAGTRAVVIGFGNIGRAIGAKLEALGVLVIGVSRHRPASEDELKAADWVVLALPSTTGTDGFVNAEFLAKLSPKAVLVNVGRGNAVEEDALAAALAEGRLAGAYLDVRAFEPSGTVPLFGANAEALDQCENCIISPHSSAFSPEYVQNCFRELVDDGCL